MLTRPPLRRVLGLAGAGILAAVVLRLASCDQAAADRWEGRAEQLLAGSGPFHQRAAQLIQVRDSALGVLRAQLDTAAVHHTQDSLAIVALAHALTGKDSLAACLKGWAACHLEVAALRRGLGADTTAREAETERADSAEHRVDRFEELVQDRPRPPRSLLFGVGADLTVLPSCALGLAGLRVEGRKRLWIFELNGRAAAGWGAAQCNGAPTLGPGFSVGVTAGF